MIVDYWFPIVMGAVAVFMCWRFPTGVGGDPFPYELGEDRDEGGPD